MFELKKYLTTAIVFNLVLSGVIVAAVYFVAVSGVFGGSVVQPFQLLVVDEDKSVETNMLVNVFNEQKQLSSVVTLTKADMQAAKTALEQGTAPAYVVIPKGFADDVKVGKNSPIRFVSNMNNPIQTVISVMLIQSGVSFLSASQAGIYGTYDYAALQGMSTDEINQRLLLPTNLKFFNRLLNYTDHFKTVVVEQTGGFSIGTHYIISFWLFFVTINMIMYINNAAFNKGVYAIYKTVGIGLFKQFAIRFFGIFTVNTVLLLPLVFFFGAKVLVASAALSAFFLMSATLFKPEACGVFLFTAALFMLFVSGGIIPLVYLPDVFSVVKLFSINYFVLSLNNGFINSAVLASVSVLFFGVAYFRGRAFCV